MKILVAAKRVPDYESKVKIHGDNDKIVTDGIKWILNPFDEIAIEEALRIKERGQATEVVVATLGPSDVVTQLRAALAMGVDRGIHVKCDGSVDSDLAARALAEIYRRDTFGLVILGKQAIDSDSGQTPQLLAALLDLPQATFASKVVVETDAVTVTREVDGGLETLRLKLPCIISTDLRLNEPRLKTLPNIMKAKSKPVEELTLEALNVSSKTKIRTNRLIYPPPRRAGRKVKDVEELVRVLRDEARVIQ